jgi:hypothetical protein
MSMTMTYAKEVFEVKIIEKPLKIVNVTRKVEWSSHFVYRERYDRNMIYNNY